MTELPNRSLSRKALTLVMIMAIVEVGLVAVILFNYFPYLTPENLNFFGSVDKLPANATIDTGYLIFEVAACVLPLSLVSLMIILADFKRAAAVKKPSGPD